MPNAIKCGLALLVCSFLSPAFGEERAPQWRSLALETSEGGSREHHFKGSSLTLEQNQGKLFYGLEVQSNYDTVDETQVSSYGFLVGYQPDWILGVEPRISLSSGIARGSERGSITTLKLEADHKMARSLYLTFGIKFFSLQGAGNISGGYQNTFFGLRLLVF